MSFVINKDRSKRLTVLDEDSDSGSDNSYSEFAVSSAGYNEVTPSNTTTGIRSIDDKTIVLSSRSTSPTSSHVEIKMEPFRGRGSRWNFDQSASTTGPRMPPYNPAMVSPGNKEDHQVLKTATDYDFQDSINLDSEHRRFRKESHKLLEELRICRKSLFDLQKEKDDAEARLWHAEEKCVLLEGINSSERESFQDQITKLQEELQMFKLTVDNLNSERAIDHEILEDTRRMLERKTATVGQHKISLEEKLMVIEQLKTKLGDLNGENVRNENETKSHNRDMEYLVCEHEKKIAAFEEAINSQRRIVEELQQKLREEKSDKDAKVEKYTDMCEKMKRYKESLEEKSKIIEVLKKSNEKISKKAENHEVSEFKINKTVSELKMDNETLTKRVKRHQETLEQKVLEIEALKKQLTCKSMESNVIKQSIKLPMSVKFTPFIEKMVSEYGDKEDDNDVYTMGLAAHKFMTQKKLKMQEKLLINQCVSLLIISNKDGDDNIREIFSSGYGDDNTASFNMAVKNMKNCRKFSKFYQETSDSVSETKKK